MSRQLRPEPVPVPARWHPNPALAVKRYRFGWSGDVSGPDEWLGEVRYVSTLHGWVWQATSFGEKERSTAHATARQAMDAVEARL